MAKVFLSQPGINGSLHQKNLLFMQSLTQEHDISLHFTENCSLITKARCEHFSRFLKSNDDYLLTLDADLMGGPPGCLDHMIEKCPKGAIIGGLYAMKAIDTQTGYPPLNGRTWDPKDKIV